MAKVVHCLVVKVEAPRKFSRQRLCRLLDRLIQIGLEDAANSVESEDEDLAVVKAIKIAPAR